MSRSEVPESVHPAVRAALVLVVAASLAFFAAWSRLCAEATRSAFPEDLDVSYLPSPKVLKVASLGFREALADLIWIEAVLYFGEKAATNRRYTHLWRYVDASLALNPYNRRLYLWAGAVAMYNFNVIDNAAVRRSIHYLERGHRHYPTDWEILFSLASNYLSELRSRNPEQVARWRRIGADYMWKAANLGGGPPWLHAVAAKVWADLGRWEIAYRRLQAVYLSTKDPNIRKNVEQQLGALLIRGADRVLLSERLASWAAVSATGAGLMRVLAEVLEESFRLRAQQFTARKLKRHEEQRRALEAEWKADMPYAPEDLFILLRPPEGDLGPCAPAVRPSSSPRSPPRGSGPRPARRAAHRPGPGPRAVPGRNEPPGP